MEQKAVFDIIFPVEKVLHELKHQMIKEAKKNVDVTVDFEKQPKKKERKENAFNPLKNFN